MMYFSGPTYYRMAVRFIVRLIDYRSFEIIWENSSFLRKAYLTPALGVSSRAHYGTFGDRFSRNVVILLINSTY